MTDILINKKITIKAQNITGGPISTFEWKIDNVLQINNTDILIIQPYQLSLGNHTISFRGENYCNKWTSELIENINIIKRGNIR